MKNARLFERTCGTLAAGVVLALGLPACAATFDVNVGSWPIFTDACNKNQILVGGFSGLIASPTQKGILLAISDRGPSPDYFVYDENGEVTEEYKLFPVPSYGPQIITLQWNPVSRSYDIVNLMPLTKIDGTPVTGLPPEVPSSGDAFDLNLNPLGFDSDSIDAEGISLDKQGNFWVCEEYKPSVAMVSPDGVVQFRLVPKGTLVGDEVTPTYDVLPGVLAKRRNNRGMEGIAVAPNGLIYTIVQRPLSNPKKATGDASRNLRLVEIDLNGCLESGGAPKVRQLLYRVEPKEDPEDLPGTYASDLYAVSSKIFLVPERKTDKLFAFNITGATDITPFETEDGLIKPEYLEDPEAEVTIEMLEEEELAALGIQPVRKAALIDSMKAIYGQLSKAEGLCVDQGEIVLTHDNDFNLADEASESPGDCGQVAQIELQEETNLAKINRVRLPYNKLSQLE